LLARLPAAGGRRIAPHVAALLLFGRSPQQWLPNGSLLAARFAGETFTDRFIKQDIRGTLPNNCAERRPSCGELVLRAGEQAQAVSRRAGASRARQ
jgi:hypothetical protein